MVEILSYSTSEKQRQSNTQAIPVCPKWKFLSLAFSNKNDLEYSCANAFGQVTRGYKWLRHPSITNSGDNSGTEGKA